MFDFLRKILDILLPPRCISCGKTIEIEDGVCQECFNKINFISQPYCKKCGMPFENKNFTKSMICANCAKDKKPVFRLARSAMRYDETSKKMIIAFKFFDRTENAKTFAKWMKIAAKDILEKKVDIIIPTPLHFTRQMKRRYNQSVLLAKELGTMTNIEVDYSSLVRVKKTRPQVEFSGVARVKNIKGAFAVKNKKNIVGKKILLVDDVMTTGSTLKECAKALKNAGAETVDFVTVARA